MNIYKKTPSFYILVAIVLYTIGCSSTNKVADYEIPTSPNSLIDSLQVYSIDQVDQSPQPKGGYSKFLSIMRYPKKARKEGATGRVVAKVVITPQGQVISPYIKSSPHPALSRETLRIVKNSTFEPGIKDGKIVYTWLEVPITYRLGKRPNM